MPAVLNLKKIRKIGNYVRRILEKYIEIDQINQRLNI